MISIGERNGNALIAVHLLLVQDSKVLLLRRYDTGYEDGNYGVVAGHLEGDEEIMDSMAREAREEAGIEIPSSALQVVGVMHRRSDTEYVDFFLAASSWCGEIQNMEPEKCDELAWFRLDSLPDNVIPYVRRGISSYFRGQWFDSLGWR